MMYTNYVYDTSAVMHIVVLQTLFLCYMNLYSVATVLSGRPCKLVCRA